LLDSDEQRCATTDVPGAPQFKPAGEALTIPFVDSLVGFDGRYTSLTERGLI
jgi:hypothetical protein